MWAVQHQSGLCAQDWQTLAYVHISTVQCMTFSFSDTDFHPCSHRCSVRQFSLQTETLQGVLLPPALHLCEPSIAAHSDAPIALCNSVSGEHWVQTACQYIKVIITKALKGSCCCHYVAGQTRLTCLGMRLVVRWMQQGSPQKGGCDENYRVTFN